MQTTAITAVLSGMATITIVRCEEIIMKTPPPPPMSMAVDGHAPSAMHVWVPGYHKGVNGRYVWVPGTWSIPPRSDAFWVPPRWEHGPRGYVSVPGRWL